MAVSWKTMRASKWANKERAAMIIQYFTPAKRSERRRRKLLIRQERFERHVALLLGQMSRCGIHNRRYSGVPDHCILEYEDYNQKICPCWLRMFPRGSRIVVIATDLTYRLSDGASITNAIEVVAREICEQFRIRPRDLILIEHYDWTGTEAAAGLGDDAEHFDLVELRWRRRRRVFIDPQWLRLSRSNVEVLTGCPLGDWCTEAVKLA